jgi:hypothetical protein
VAGVPGSTRSPGARKAEAAQVAHRAGSAGLTQQGYEPVRKLGAADEIQAFDCGEPALNGFLERFALTSQQSHSAQTYVSCCSGAVAGYYSPAVGSVEPAGLRLASSRGCLAIPSS